jgi:TonB family protein
VRTTALALAFVVASAAGAEPPNPYAEGTTTIGVDGAEAPPTVAERIEWIRKRLAEVLIYPKIAQRNGLEGVSTVQFVVGPDGRARYIKTLKTSGHLVLDRAAERAAVDAGELPRVLGKLEVPIRFSLEEERRRHPPEEQAP